MEPSEFPVTNNGRIFTRPSAGAEPHTGLSQWPGRGVCAALPRLARHACAAVSTRLGTQAPEAGPDRRVGGEAAQGGWGEGAGLRGGAVPGPTRRAGWEPPPPRASAPASAQGQGGNGTARAGPGVGWAPEVQRGPVWRRAGGR